MTWGLDSALLGMLREAPGFAIDLDFGLDAPTTALPKSYTGWRSTAPLRRWVARAAPGTAFIRFLTPPAIRHNP